MIMAALARPQFPQQVELGPEELCPQLGPRVFQLRQPLRSLFEVVVNPLARGLDAAGPEQSLETKHDAGGVPDQILVGAGQLLEPDTVGVAVIDHPQAAAPEELGRLVGIGPVVLVAVSQLPRRSQTMTLATNGAIRSCNHRACDLATPTIGVAQDRQKKVR